MAALLCFCQGLLYFVCLTSPPTKTPPLPQFCLWRVWGEQCQQDLSPFHFSSHPGPGACLFSLLISLNFSCFDLGFLAVNILLLKFCLFWECLKCYALFSPNSWTLGRPNPNTYLFIHRLQQRESPLFADCLVTVMVHKVDSVRGDKKGPSV